MGQDISFQNIPDEYKLMMEEIQNPIIQKLYNQLNFRYIKIDFEKNQAKTFLFGILKYFNFIVYEISSLNDQNTTKESVNIVNAVVCVEKKCFIIENIEKSLLLSVFNDIKSSVINITKESNQYSKDSSNIFVDTEISSFCEYFSQEIESIFFVKYTIKPIACYLIRRYFYPSSYFKDPSFFSFDKNMENVNNLNFESLEYLKMKQRINIEKENRSNFKYYTENEFIKLRQVHSTDSAIFYFVIHIKSLYVFMMKTINPHDEHFKKEIYFCQNYSHRCFTRFYGFIHNPKLKYDNIIGFLYEFMSNGNISDYLQSKPIDTAFSFMAMNRLFQGISYLQDNFLICRDIKPLNILIDHDNIPYISDFDTIKKIGEENDIMTQNIGVVTYTSPEQITGGEISFPTDIYSFGQLIYFLFEHKSMFETRDITAIIQTIKNSVFPKIKNVTNNIQFLFEKCIEFDPKKRLSKNEIHQIIFKEIDLTNYLYHYLVNEKLLTTPKDVVKNYIYENIIFLVDNYADFGNEVEHIYKNYILFFSKIKANRNISSSINMIGFMYYQGLDVEIDYSEAIKYFKIAAELNEPNAIFNIGFFYAEGLFFDKNYLKAKEYFELAAKQNHIYSFLYLGKMYYEGYGVEKNYIKAREYLELAAKGNEPEAYMILGLLYMNGLGVKQDYAKSKKYFELAYKMGNGEALNFLGALYLEGHGVEKDYLKAKEYFELSAKNNDKIANLLLGIIYYEGLGVVIDYTRAKYHFEISANQNYPEAFNWLGVLYYEGKINQPDYTKAIEYFELGAKHNDSLSLYNLGKIYAFESNIKKNYTKAKESFELSSKLGNIKSLFYLGLLYFEGRGVEKDYLKSKTFFEISAEKGYINAFFYLGLIYENGIGVNVNIPRALQYFKKNTILIGNQLKFMFNNGAGLLSNTNDYLYISHNEIGLIYITNVQYKNIDFAQEHLKKAGLNEYPFGQNNYGVFLHYFKNNDVDAQYFFEKASKNHFCLAEFNLAVLFEKNNKHTESIQYYLKVIEHENKQLLFRNIIINDKYLNISKTFIICFSRLKISQFYLSKEDLINSKKYFVMALISLLLTLLFQNDTKSYSFEFHDKFILSDLMDFIFNYPLFDLYNESKPSSWKKYKLTSNKSNKIKRVNIGKLHEKNLQEFHEKVHHNSFDNDKKLIDDIFYESVIKILNDMNLEIIENEDQQIFSFMNQIHFISDDKNNCYLQFFDNLDQFFFNDLNNFKNIIDSIIKEMSSILFTPPYLILFGRIRTRQKKKKRIDDIKNIDHSFYEGFNIS